jgi:hypothetical protein
LAALPPPIHHAVASAYATSLGTVFLVAAPIIGVAFVLSLFLPELPLRSTTKAPELDQVLGPSAAPTTRSSLEEISRALSVLARRENQAEIYRALASRAGVDVDPVQCWLLLRLRKWPGGSIEGLVKELNVSQVGVVALLEELATKELVELIGEPPAGPQSPDPRRYGLTAEGIDALAKLVSAREDGLKELVADWGEDDLVDVGDMVARLAADLCDNPRRGGPPPARTLANA